MNQNISLRQQALSWTTLLRIGPTARGILPFLLGTTIAWSQGYAIDWIVFLLSALAVFCIMLITFLFNEYYDYEADIINKQFHSLSGGSRVLPLGLVRRTEALLAAYALILPVAIIGLVLYFYYETGPLTIPLGVLALLIGYFYTAKPIQLSYRGLGEIAILFSCGWLATIMGYYLQTGHIDNVAILASLPGAFSIFLVILINELPDIASDRVVGKRNLAVRLGKEKAALLYVFSLLICYISIIAIVFFGVPKITALLSLVLLPIIGWNILSFRKKGSLEDTKTLESVALRTMLLDHLITFIFIGAFIKAGLDLVGAEYSNLTMIGIVCLFSLGLEGLSVVCSKIVRSK